MPFESIETTADRTDASAVREELWLLGQPALTDFLDFVSRAVVGGEAMDRRGADRRLARRRTTSTTSSRPTRRASPTRSSACRCPTALEPLAAELEASPHFARTFDRMPTTFGMVELDKIVVSQRRVTKTFVDALRRPARAASPTRLALFRFCQPLRAARSAGDDPPARRRTATSSSRSRTTCACTRRRCSGPTSSSATRASGRSAAAVGLVVGYGSNFLSLIRSDDRMVLHNGYHRAVAMRAAGITHAPCIDPDGHAAGRARGRRPRRRWSRTRPSTSARAGRRCSRTSSTRAS